VNLTIGVGVGVDVCVDVCGEGHVGGIESEAAAKPFQSDACTRVLRC